MSGLPQILQGQLSHVATVAMNKTGKKPGPNTVWRWCTKGVCKGTVKLQAVHHSGYWQTTPEAFNQFILDQTAYHTK